MTLLLASKSEGRRAILRNAGVPHEAVTAGVDEEAAKEGLRAGGISARDLADALAELKAVRVSARKPDAMVLGCDSVVALDDGSLLDKPADRTDAARQLRLLSGQRHSLYSAAVIAEGGRVVWRHVDRAIMHVRSLSDAFIESYLDGEFDQIRHCIGGYRIEGPGAQLFARIEGSQFTIIGLPLLPLLDYLRVRGIMPS